MDVECLKVTSMLIAASILCFAAFSALSGSAYAEPPEKRIQVGDLFTVVSKHGIALLKVDGDVVRRNASLTLTIRVAEVGERWFKFKVEGGCVEIDGVVHPVTYGEGAARLKISPRVAFIELKGEVQDGVLHLEGVAFLRHGRIMITLGGVLHLDDAAYRLRFLAAPAKQPSTETSGREARWIRRETIPTTLLSEMYVKRLAWVERR